MCVFITAGPSTKLFALGGGDTAHQHVKGSLVDVRKSAFLGGLLNFQLVKTVVKASHGFVLWEIRRSRPFRGS